MISVLFALALAGAIAGGAQPPADAQAGAPQVVRQVRRSVPKPEAVVGDRADVAMPATAGLPTLTVKINRKGPFKLGFDTGASGGAHITAALADALGLSPIGEGMAMDPSGRNPQPIKVYKLDTVELGGITIKGLPASAAPGQASRREGLDGIIGLGPFDGFVVSLDYEKGRFRLERGALPAPDGATSFAYSAFIPEAPLTIEGKTLTAHLDTGNTRFGVIVPEAFAKGLAKAAAAKSIGEAHTLGNVIAMSAAPTSAPVLVGVVPLPVTEIGWPTVIDRANVGSLALRHMLLQVDPANRRVKLSPAGK